jgi:hypothetical protein
VKKNHRLDERNAILGRQSAVVLVLRRTSNTGRKRSELDGQVEHSAVVTTKQRAMKHGCNGRKILTHPFVKRKMSKPAQKELGEKQSALDKQQRLA